MSLKNTIVKVREMEEDTMNLIKTINSGISSLKSSLKRFPYALAFPTITAIILITLVNGEGYYNSETIDLLQRLAMTTALGFPLFLIIKAIIERKTTLAITYKFIIRIAALIILIAYHFLLLNEISMVTVTRFIAINLALYLLFLVIPYLYNNKNFELYVIKVFSRLLITFIYSGVLFAGLSSIIFTLNKLLNVPVTEEIYVSTGLVVMGIFAPIFLLAEIPQQNDKISRKEFPDIFEILLLYIIMPLITVYTFILYIYFAKIIVIQQWPEGLVGHLVIWYASFSILLLFFISPLKEKSKWVRSFSQWLPVALIPLLFMMFIAIGIRINSYGFTESRYYVVLLGLWLIGISLYYIFSKIRNNIILPLTLSIIALLSVFGPWSSYSVSIHSQNNRFTGIIQKYNMIEDNTIVRKNVQITENDQEEIKSILRYFEYNHNLEDLKYLPDNFKLKETKELFGFTYRERPNPNRFQHFHYNINRNNQGLIIKKYDYFFHISNRHKKFNITKPDYNLNVTFNKPNNEIIITQNDDEIYSKILSPE